MSLALALVANTRLPSRRAQALQVVHAAAAFARAGRVTALLHARRAAEVEVPMGTDLCTWYGVPPGARPTFEAIACTDWIDRVPRALQYLPARVQELTFARNAASAVLARHREARVLAREVETGARLARRGHARLYLEIHRVPAGRARRAWLARAAKGARGVIAISGGVRDDLVALAVDPNAILVEHDAFEPLRLLPRGATSRAEARAELDLDANAPLVVYTGGLLAWKGVDVLVDAARELPDVRVAIAGGMAADVARLRARVAGLPNVRVDDFQPPERIGLYLAAADVGAVPNRAQPPISARYTSPLKVYESLAAGLPLVASDLPSLREALAGDDAAEFVAPDDPRALAKGIRALLADPARRARMAERGRARAADHTWDARAARLLAWMDARERA